VELGGTLVLICRIRLSYEGSYNSSAICFRHNNERYCSPPEVIVVDNRTAQLRFTNVTFDNKGHFHCEMPDLTGQWHGQQAVAVVSK